MSTRSFIAKQIGDDEYLTIYCHSDGYLSYNGAMLIDHYNTEEKVDELLKLGDLSCLCQKLNPDPTKPHSFDYGERQKDVTVAYGRDRGETNIEARTYSMEKLDDPQNWTEYVYIFNKDNGWKYFRSGQSEQGLRDIEEDLKKEYAQYGVERLPNHYGFVSQDIVDSILEEQDTSFVNDEELQNVEPIILM